MRPAAWKQQTKTGEAPRGMEKQQQKEIENVPDKFFKKT